MHDDRAPLAAGAGCAAVDARTVTCAVANPNPSLTLALGDGDDLLAAGDAPGWAIRADGGPGADVLRGGPGDDVLGGGAGDDVLGGEAGEDRLDGGGGADRLLPGVAGVAGDRVRCGAGRDTVTVTPRLDAPLLRPECEQITAGVLRVERWSFPAALRLAVRAAPGERACRGAGSAGPRTRRRSGCAGAATTGVRLRGADRARRAPRRAARPLRRGRRVRAPAGASALASFGRVRGCVRVLMAMLAVVLLLPAPALAGPGDPPVEPVLPADGAVLPTNADGIEVRYVCPEPYHITSPDTFPVFGDRKDYGVHFAASPELGSDGRLLQSNLVAIAGPDAGPGQRHPRGAVPRPHGRPRQPAGVDARDVLLAGLAHRASTVPAATRPRRSAPSA